MLHYYPQISITIGLSVKYALKKLDMVGRFLEKKHGASTSRYLSHAFLELLII